MGDPEHFARLICMALHADLSPDDRVAHGEPRLVGGHYAIPGHMHTNPLWRLYEPAGRAIADEVERRLEAVHQDYVDEVKERE